MRVWRHRVPDRSLTQSGVAHDQLAALHHQRMDELVNHALIGRLSRTQGHAVAVFRCEMTMWIAVMRGGGGNVKPPRPREGHIARTHAQIKHIALRHLPHLTIRADLACVPNIDDAHFTALHETGRARLCNFIKAQTAAIWHSGAKGEAVIMRITQLDLAALKQTFDQKGRAQHCRIHTLCVVRVNGMAGFNLDHQGSPFKVYRHGAQAPWLIPASDHPLRFRPSVP